MAPHSAAPRSRAAGSKLVSSKPIGAELAEKLIAKDGPLGPIQPENIDRIETNLQIAHAPKSPRHDFRTDYLLKVFRLRCAGAALRRSAA